MNDQAMETECRDKMWQCRYCSSHFPSEFAAILPLHLQWHIESKEGHYANHYRCTWSHNRNHLCREVFQKAEELAHHILNCHTKWRYCSISKGKYKKAWADSEREKYQLIQELGSKDDTPAGIFHPARPVHQA